MMRRLHSVVCFVVGFFLLVGFSAWSQAASGVDAVVIFATNSVHVDATTKVWSGDIVVNDLSNGPTLEPGFELMIKKNAFIAGAIWADSIKIDKGVTVGAVECNNGVGVDCAGLTLPVFRPEELPEIRTFVLGDEAEDVVVGPGDPVVLEPGNYFDITIEEGGTLVFTGGIYNIGSILPASTKGKGCAFAPCRSMEFLAPSDVRVLGMFDIGSEAFVGPGDGSTALASNIVVTVLGTNLVPEDPASKPPAAQVGQASTVEANIWTPNGTLHLHKNVTATGAFWGRDVEIDKEGQISLASAFNQPPSADAQNVSTINVTFVDITLTGSDPEGEDLEFSIVSGPSEGVLTGLVQDPPSSATVKYTVNEPGEDLPDEFTFRVTDPNGGFDEAVVFVNPAEPPPPPDPTYTNTVTGKDLAVEVITGSDHSITLIASLDVEFPENVSDLEFSIVTAPSLGLVSSPSQESQTSASVVYTAPSSPGFDSFDYEVCGDLNDNGNTTDPGECDVATVSIDVEVYTAPTPPVAEDLKITTVVNTPVEINLSDPAGDLRGSQKRVVDLDGPNLTVTSFSAPACAVLGEVIGDQIQITVKNDSQVDMPAAVDPDPDPAIGFYISTDPTIDTFDTLLTGGREHITDLLPAGGSIHNFLYTGASINGASPTGSVWIGVLVDEDDVIDEGDETDNTAAVQIDIVPAGTPCPPSAQPDLVVSSLTHDPAAPTTETEMEFKAVVENIGNDVAGPSTLSFKIGGESPNTPAALFSIPQLGPGDTETVVRNENLSVAQGYQNTAVADYNGEVAESDENNNTTIDTFTVAEVVETTQLTATILTFPQFGTLFDSSGLEISPQSILPDTTVSYEPDEGSTATDSFTYLLTDHSTGLSSAVAQVDLRVFQARLPGLCVTGREPACWN